MTRQIKQGEKEVWIHVKDTKTGQYWDVSPDWLKQHLGVCILNDTTEYLQKQIDELETTIINNMLPLFQASLKLHFKAKGQIDTRELNKILARRELRLERKALHVAFNLMVEDGTLQFESQGKGHPRIWSLKETKQ